MGDRVVKFGRQAERLGRHETGDAEQLKGGGRRLRLGAHEIDPGLEQFLFGVEHVEHGAGADGRFLFDALQGDGVGFHRGAKGGHPRARRLQLFPAPRGRFAHIAAGCVQLAPTLRGDVPQAAHARIFLARLVERDGDVGDDFGGVRQRGEGARVPGAPRQRVDADPRQQRRAGDIDVAPGGAFQRRRAENRRVAAQAAFERRGGRFRRVEAGDDGEGEASGRRAHDLFVVRAGDFEIPFGLDARRPRVGHPRLGLRYVGAGDLAHMEAVARRLQLPFENLFVVGVELDDRLVAHDDDIGLGGVGEHLLFDVQKAGARRRDPLLRRFRPRRGDAEGVDILRDAELHRGRIGAVPRARRARRLLRSVVGLHRLVVRRGERKGRVLLEPPVADAGLRLDDGPPAGEGDGDVFVGRAQRGALRQQARVGRVGLRQGLPQRLRGRCGGREDRARGDRDRRGRAGRPSTEPFPHIAPPRNRVLDP